MPIKTNTTAHFYFCIHVPILFSNIQKKLYIKYNMIDTRPLPEIEEAKDAYIHQGLLAKNSKNEVEKLKMKNFECGRIKSDYGK